MKKNQIKKIEVINDVCEVEIKDYRTPNRHYGSLKNQFVSTEEFNKVKSNLRHSLNDEYDTRLTYL